MQCARWGDLLCAGGTQLRLRLGHVGLQALELLGRPSIRRLHGAQLRASETREEGMRVSAVAVATRVHAYARACLDDISEFRTGFLSTFRMPGKNH